ncbi:MAG: hypothetical protein CMJ64_09520 [Planctomycetaceae bacterium]|nr:hypothetical protein [Planctomycetaceae bacterium]
MIDGCGTHSHLNRRTLLRAAGLSGLGWLTPVAEALSRADEKAASGKPPKSVIVLWLAGGPSQLETFDPKPGTNIAGGTKAIDTSVKGIQLAEGYEELAEQMDYFSLVRSVTSQEGDHERATYNVKTGFRPDPTLIHPSIGAVLCYQQPDNVEIPRHISILSSPWPARGGYLGDQYDAFKIDDPQGPIPDITKQVPDDRFDQRVKDLAIVERQFARGRLRELAGKTLQGLSTRAALKMMSSEQLKAFDVKEAPEALRGEFGDTPFGRGCLAAGRLVEVGVRCVEVTLRGWDTHANNHENHTENAKTLDPAFAALIRYLRDRELLDDTVIVCGGEVGRTPRINPYGGRDHWPYGFTVALAGGGIAGGRVIGETSPNPDPDAEDKTKDLANPHNTADIHATMLETLGVDFRQELQTPVGRPMIVSQGEPITELLG